MGQKFATQYTTTGTKDAVDISDTSRISFVISSENADATITLQGKLKTGWYTLGTSWTDGQIEALVSTVDELRLVISSLGTSGFVDFEILGD